MVLGVGVQFRVEGLGCRVQLRAEDFEFTVWFCDDLPFQTDHYLC